MYWNNPKLSDEFFQKEVYSLNDVFAILSVRPNVIYQRFKNGKLTKPPHRTPIGELAFTKQTLLTFLQECLTNIIPDAIHADKNDIYQVLVLLGDHYVLGEETLPYPFFMRDIKKARKNEQKMLNVQNEYVKQNAVEDILHKYKLK